MEKTPLWEDLLLILAIALLWPFAFKRAPLTSNTCVVISFFIATVILVRRLKRFWTIRKHNDGTQ
jgi:surface polysaccharide O-acyltransferase-like enzyme